jgi:hypothetical protein
VFYEISANQKAYLGKKLYIYEIHAATGFYFMYCSYKVGVDDGNFCISIWFALIEI